ncbi:MAG TPA: SPFH domain-containing protein [Propionibacteriaceae bacterium]|jgi:regulator of protease activity HflC (stomatin/prohibitin superfamily)|nr:SPFH domain-containing protein [Propionibacteriaceae bacterium]
MPVNGVLEYLWFRDNDPWWATLLRAVTLIALVVLFAFKGMHKVPTGSRALRTRFNKVVHYRRDIYDRLGYTVHGRGEAKVVGPGLVIGIPFVHNVMIESVTEQFEPLPPLIRVQPLREFASQINFRVVDLEQALVGVADYKGLLVNSCAAAVRRLVQTTDLSDDDISARVLADETLQQRTTKLGVRLLELNVSTSNLTEPAQLAHAFKQEGIVIEGTPAAVLAARTVNGASSPAALTAVDGDAPAA